MIQLIYTSISAIPAALVAIFGKILLQNIDSAVASGVRAGIMFIVLFFVIIFIGRLPKITSIDQHSLF